MDIKGRTGPSSSRSGKKVAYEWIWIVEKTWWKYKSRRSAVLYVVTGTWRDRSGETWTSGSRDWSGSLIRAFMYYVGWHIPESRGMLHRLYVPHYTTIRPDPTHDVNGNNRNGGEASSTPPRTTARFLCNHLDFFSYPISKIKDTPVFTNKRIYYFTNYTWINILCI